jgi:hypothetical protein
MSPLFGLVASSSSGIVATGGTITTSGGYKIHTFTSTSSFVLTANPNSELFEIFALGGGGNGGGGGNVSTYNWAGVGGAPGSFVHKSFTITTGTHTVTIGGSGGGATSLGSVVNTGTTPNGQYGTYPDYTYLSNANYPIMGLPRTQYGDSPSTSISFGNVTATRGGTYTTTISGSSVTYGGIGAAGSGGYTDSAATGTGGSAGSAATGYGAGGGGGSKPASATNFTNGASGSAGILIVRYRA